LNLGCGKVVHPQWVNIDLRPAADGVLQHDLTEPLPFEPSTIEVCYSAHVLEHLRRDQARDFIAEQYRVLVPGGVIRVVVPDLEMICRTYLENLEQVAAGRQEAAFRYDYSLLELYDQTTRDRSGGEMWNVWTSGAIPDVEYVVSRHGLEALETIEQHAHGGGGPDRGLGARARKLLTRDGIGRAAAKARLRLAELLVSASLPRGARASLREGLFRNSGEIHRVMYDRYSLDRLLRAQGFVDVQTCEAGESRIPEFGRYHFDVVDGQPRKPDSLYLEAVRPR